MYNYAILCLKQAQMCKHRPLRLTSKELLSYRFRFISIISNYNSFSLRVCINLIECQYLRRLRGDAILEINQQINKSKYLLWRWMAIYIEMCTLHLSFNIQVHVHLIRYFSNCFSHMLTNCCTRHFILKFEIDKVVLGRQITLFFC